MARTDYGAILSSVIKDTSDAIREVKGSNALISPAEWGNEIRSISTGEEPLEFTKTSVVDKTRFPSIAFNEDYTNYDLLLFVYTDTTDNKQIEFLLPSSMITEIFAYTQIMFNREGGNHYARYSKSSNVLFSQIASNQFTLVDVYSITCNKTIIPDDIYKRGGTSSSSIAISHNGITDNDVIFITAIGNGFIVVPNTYVNLSGGFKDINTSFCFGFSQYNANSNPVLIGYDYMTEFYYFMVQGIKFA